eukprot:TRINITY_DN4348_c1_g2_i3.p1 TRINITY_DN4348_c1_g2~~TRINITY_DN4348_c1_g2_i3.p1  ORF type:complete len:718 (+),score=178.65 TRINITY_DN4348_c1_g2_i3:1273-3426(+)
MAVVKFGRHGKRPFGLGVKVALVVILGLCFIVAWSLFSSPSSLISSQRSSFGDISAPVYVGKKGRDHQAVVGSGAQSGKGEPVGKEKRSAHKGSKDGKVITHGRGSQKKDGGRVTEHDEEAIHQRKEGIDLKQEVIAKKNANETKTESKKESEGEGSAEEGGDEDVEIDGETVEDLAEKESPEEKMEDENNGLKAKGKKKNTAGPLFVSRAHYTWKSCNVRSKYNYIPCIDIERASGKQQSYRHGERSCPRTPPMCLVPLPGGYASPVHWPESKMKILYRNVAHPKLAAFIGTHSWLSLSGDYLTFPQNQSLFKGGAHHYVDSIEEMVPDIEWGKNIRIVLDIGCTDVSFGSALLDKDVLTLSFGLKDDQADLAQVALERGFLAVIGSMALRRLPFPSGVFDAIHCGGCRIPWHSNGGKLILEMNRILRPGGYFVLSTEHENIEVEEAMSKLMASICWNILAHRTDDVSEVSVKIYQKPSSNDIYELRRKKNPPLCKEDENPDAVWYAPMKTCLHTVPAAIEERGTEWPEEWPKRLESFPDWLNEREKLAADSEHWKAIINKSYLNGMGIDWSSVRNIMDMKAIYGGFAAALASQNVWVMNVIPVHAPQTLPIIYERGLVGIYHDWCESFGSYPRSYDLLHADHLFSRLKKRCKQPVGIVVEMDRLLRPGGWAIIRDKVEILDPLEVILRSLHWEIHMTYAKDKEGIICAQKTMWRP